MTFSGCIQDCISKVFFDAACDTIVQVICLETGFYNNIVLHLYQCNNANFHKRGYLGDLYITADIDDWHEFRFMFDTCTQETRALATEKMALYFKIDSIVSRVLSSVIESNGYQAPTACLLGDDQGV